MGRRGKPKRCLRPLATEGETLAAFEDLIRYNARKFNLTDRDFHEDLLQEGRLAVLEAMRNFREDGGASFNTYVIRNVFVRMVDCCRARYGSLVSVRDMKIYAYVMKHYPEDLTLFLQDEAAVRDVGKRFQATLQVIRDAVTYHRRVFTNDLFMPSSVSEEGAGEELCAGPSSWGMDAEWMDVKAILSRLPERERLILLGWATGETSRSSAEAIGISQARACQLRRQALQRAREDLARALHVGGERRAA